MQPLSRGIAEQYNRYFTTTLANYDQLYPNAGHDTELYQTLQARSDPNYKLAEGYEIKPDSFGNTFIHQKPGFWDKYGERISKGIVLGGLAVGTAGALAPAAFGGGVTGTVASGATGGAINGAASNALNGQNVWEGALKGGVTGAASGGLGALTSKAPAATGLANATGTGASKMGWSDALLSAAGGKTASGGVDYAGLVKTGLGVAKGLSEGRGAEQAANTASTITRDSQGISAQAQNDQARAQAAQIEMEQKEAQRTALNDAYKNALRSSLALNMKDASLPFSTGSGGARPSAIGEQGKQAAELMNAKALTELMDPTQLTKLPMPDAYSLTDLPKQSGLDTALGIAGTVGNVLTQQQQRTDATKQNDLIAQLLADTKAQVNKPTVGASTPMPTQPAPMPQLGLQIPANKPNFGPNNWAGAVSF